MRVDDLAESAESLADGRLVDPGDSHDELGVGVRVTAVAPAS
jgi:hypothetical protein